LLGTPKDVLSKALEWVSISIEAPLLGNMEGHSFLRAFEIKGYVKMPCKRLSLSTGVLLGNLEGIRLPVLFDRKGKYIWVPFLDPEYIQIFKSGGHLELW
jgi:hypothetical protein